MIGVAARAADPPARQAPQQLGARHVEVDHPVEGEALSREESVERLGLRHRAREAVEHAAGLGVGLLEALAHQPDDHVVGDAATPARRRRLGPPKERGGWNQRIRKSGSTEIRARKIAPGRVIRVRVRSMYSAVFLPGRTPGMNPPYFFMLSARSMGLNTMAV